MRKFYLLLLSGLFFSQLTAQQELKHCGADEVNLQFLHAHPTLLNNWINNYHLQEEYIQTYQRGADTIIKIPCVVHVIHFDGAENISDAQIKNGIEILTRNYRKQNPDTVEIVPFFQPIAADMQIEFELAKLDPEGNCTNGINRVRSMLTNTGGHNVKELIHWPREKYLNIYVVKDAAGLAGHALMPFQADSIPEQDGIVIAGDYVGNIGSSNNLRSVVLSHEVGHYLNLFHIWGGNNVPGFYYLPCADPGNCAYDDGVFDTPNTIGWASCNLAGNSCDTVLDNVQNFMDYAYCARMFTEGQKDRARAALHSPIAQRNNLWTTSNLNQTGLSGTLTLCSADIKADRQIYCPGDSIQFYDASLHGATQWNWNFGDGNTSTLQNPKHAYTANGNYDVTLTVSNGMGTLTSTKTNFIYIVESTSSFYLPYTEGFEWVDSLHETGMVGFVENNQPWEIVNGISATGDQCVKVNNQNDALQYKYSLVSPTLDLTGIVTPHIDFKYAFAQKDSTNKDVMAVRVSKNCGATWLTLNQQTGGLPTHSGYVDSNYVPLTVDWRQMAITNIPGSYKTNTFLFRIDFISGGGNDFYLDDINVYDAASIGIEENPTLYFQVYPNPASQLIEITGDFETAQLELINLHGQVLLDKNMMPGEKISVEELSNGVYLARIISGNQIGFRKVVINH